MILFRSLIDDASFVSDRSIVQSSLLTETRKITKFNRETDKKMHSNCGTAINNNFRDVAVILSNVSGVR
jgi:hypothetical protein